MTKNSRLIEDVIGKLPYRLALAGGWIDQPFVSMHNPSPSGSMVVVNVEPQFWFIERAGICSSTRKIAIKLWRDGLPQESPDELVQKLYMEENKGNAEPSGSQDMIGLIYPGISRLDYDYTYREGVFPKQIESCNDPQIAKWLEKAIHILPVAPRPEEYNPLEIKNLSPEWISRLGKSGKNCYEAIIAKNVDALGASMNECMACWEKILPGTVRHHKLNESLLSLLEYYRSNYPGAMYSGCGGGYLFVASQDSVPGAFKIKVRIRQS